MEDSYQILIDGNSGMSVSEFHELMKRELHFPDYYGMNADALWDGLGDHLLSNCKITIRWVGFQRSYKVMGDKAEILRSVLFDAEKEYRGNLKVSIED